MAIPAESGVYADCPAGRRAKFAAELAAIGKIADFLCLFRGLRMGKDYWDFHDFDTYIIKFKMEFFGRRSV